MKQLIVIGGGAAGFFCALNAARMNRDLQVIILEKTNKLLSKVRVSGGGRCNVTHACFEIQEMIRCYPRGANFLKKTFHQYFTTDTIQWFKERGVNLKTEPDGRMFPTTDSSQTIIDCLLKEANQYGVEVIMNAEAKLIEQIDNRFKIHLSDARLLPTSDFLCIACGGYPKSSMFDWLKQLGHSIEEPVPSLFTFNAPTHPITKLMGVSVPNANVRILNSKLDQDGPVLITHWGLSGPAILKLSAWGARELAVQSWQFTVQINWMPDFNEEKLKAKFRQLRSDSASQKIIYRNPLGLPRRLWEFLVHESGIEVDCNWSQVSSKYQARLITNLLQYRMEIKGKTSFKEEFVTAGGIRLSEIDANTLMSKKIPNLFFAGEVLDVDGITGGFNFQHAWTSGYVAGKSISDLSM